MSMYSEPSKQLLESIDEAKPARIEQYESQRFRSQSPQTPQTASIKPSYAAQASIKPAARSPSPPGARGSPIQEAHAEDRRDLSPVMQSLQQSPGRDNSPTGVFTTPHWKQSATETLRAGESQVRMSLARAASRGSLSGVSAEQHLQYPGFGTKSTNGRILLKFLENSLGVGGGAGRGGGGNVFGPRGPGGGA